MTPIESVSKTETKNFGQVPVNEFWLEISTGASSGSQEKKYLDHIKSVLDSVKNGVICVFSEELSSKSLCEALANACDNGNRIYILTNDYHSEMTNLEGCLIRYGGNKRLGSFILINPNPIDPNINSPTGCLFTGRFSEGSINLSANLLLDLDNAQVSTLYRYFCYQFWKKAEKERIGNEERDVGDAPLDIYPPVEDTCDFQYLKTVWDKKTDNALVTTSLLSENAYLKFSSFSNSIVLSLFSGIDDSLVRSLKQKNNKIYTYEDAALINSLKSNDGIWLVPKTDSASEEEVYAIKLDSEQANVLDKHISALSQEKTQYQYFANDIRGNLSGKTIFPLGGSVSQKFTINAEGRPPRQSVTSPALLPKEEFENLNPDFADDGRSVSITYEWENIPFPLPKGSVKHQLYKDWENAEKAIINYSDDILNDISENEKKEGKILGRIKHFFLGKQQKFSEYRKELENLTTIKYSSVEKTELEERIKQINEIRKLVDKDSSEIEEENRKAEIEEKIESKQKEIKKCEDECNEKERELQEKQKDIETKSALKEVLQKELIDLNSEKKSIETEIASLQDKIKNITDNERESREAELADKQKNLQEKENIINSKVAELEELRKQSGDLKIAKNKITNERDDKNNKIKRFNNEINSFKDQLKTPVKVKQKDKTVLKNMEKGGGKTPTPSGQVKELAVPQFPHLPHTGELFQHNGQAYLAITHWEEYDEGKKETERLKAAGLDIKLCAKGENNG